MKEEILLQIRTRINSEKEGIVEKNNRIKRIRELEKISIVLEYLKLINESVSREKCAVINESELIMRVFNSHLYHIGKNDTNNIFVYMGTYRKSYDIDIVHPTADYIAAYDSPDADYRLYRDLEQKYGVEVNIADCADFEQKHIIIKRTPFNRRDYDELQKCFVINAVENGQEYAKSKVLEFAKSLGAKK